jgi:hypothetical protein
MENLKRKTGYNTVSLILIFTIAVNMLALFPIKPSQAQGPTMTFTTGETININSNDYIDFWSNVSMTFTSGIQVQFIEVLNGNGILESCDVIQVVFPPGFVMEPCSWWEVLDPLGNPMEIEFHIDQQYYPSEFHVDMVWPGPFPLPVPGGTNFAEKKISVIEPCEWYVVHWPSGWYPAPCSWWEIIDPETQHPTGYEFHVDMTNESCEFHIDDVIPGPYTLPFPWHQIEARKKISQITPCDWFAIITGTVPEPNSWWEIMYQGQATGLEFHVDQSNSTSGLFHVDAVLPDPLKIAPAYPTTARRKIGSIEPCTWLKVADPASTPQPCTWWKITNPAIGDYEFHVDQSNQDGTFHVDLVYPSTIPITPAADTVIAEKKITTIQSCDWFKVITGGLPQPCSWWMITSPAEWAGVVFHVDSTDGISKFHIDQADTLPPGPAPPAWSVTAEEYTPPDPWYWKPEQRDYAPSGVPDFDQRQGGTYLWQDMAQQWSHCGPVAVANSLWWLDSEFEPNPMPQPIINDGFPLVQTYGQWDDHAAQNVAPLVEHLAYLMDTDGRRTGIAHSGTDVHDMEAGLAHYLSWTGVNPAGDVNGDGVVDTTDGNMIAAAYGSIPGSPKWNLAADIWPASTSHPPVADNEVDLNDQLLWSNNYGRTGSFYEHTVMQPDFFFIENEVERCQDVVLLVGYWIFNTQTGEWYREPGGHYVTVAGVDSTDMKLALSDPVQDAFESGLIPEGRIPVPHMHLPPEPPYITHNDAQYVSQDIYSVAQISPPWLPPCLGGNWRIVDFASWRPAPPYFAVIESAVVTSPLAEHDLAVINVTTSKQGCLPVPTIGRNYTLQINVTVENQGGYVESFFDVWTELSLGMPPPITVGPATVASLGIGETVTLTFNWDTTGVAFGNYTVTGVVETVAGETDTEDNTCINGVVMVTFPGDVDGSRRVEMIDMWRIQQHYGGVPGNSKWDPNCDVDGSGRIEMLDMWITQKHFGDHW